MRALDEVEDYRLVCVPTRSGFRTYVVWDDGVELVESVNLDAAAGS